MKQLDLFNINIATPVELEKSFVEEPAIDGALPETQALVTDTEAVILPDDFVKREKKQKKPKHIEEEEEVVVVKNKRGRKSYKETDVEIALVEVPDDEILFKKQYYSIGEVAGWFGVNHSLIRFWENEFDILKPRKNRKGDRLFRPEDVKNLQLIYYLLRNCKYSVEGAKQYLKDNKKKADLDMILIASLTKFRSFLLELQANLQP